MSELEEKRNCIIADIGAQIGDILRCLIESEMASHTARINQLQALLSGNICSTPPESSDSQSGEVPPTA